MGMPSALQVRLLVIAGGLAVAVLVLPAIVGSLDARLSNVIGIDRLRLEFWLLAEGDALGAALSSSYCRHAFDRNRHCGMQQINGIPRRTQSS
jgi:hypothetical protein